MSIYTTTAKLDDTWQETWPSDGLETVGHCPICGESARESLHTGLVDNAFRAAPGKWTLWKCAKCSSAYLDPRPTQDTIHLAYANYYTHQEVACKVDYASLDAFRKLRRRMVNGYTNWRYGTHAKPSSALGVLVISAIPNIKKLLSQQYRHMPKLPSKGGRLLDIGCGDGSFLRLARTCGWDVVGIDPDPKAAANAAKQSLTVHEGGIEYFDGKAKLFDVITLNHVIEHVYDPIKVLKTCYDLLKPGGQLWLSTPNIDSFGHQRFRNNWRGLETPRHLVLFNRHSLSQAFISAGFPAPIDRECRSSCKGMFKMSFAMELGLNPYDALTLPITLQLHAAIAAFAGMIFPSRREFLTVTAQKSID